jgi:hypothetical protein
MKELLCLALGWLLMSQGHITFHYATNRIGPRLTIAAVL